MYFLYQIKTQLIQTIFAFEFGNQSSGPDDGLRGTEATVPAQEQENFTPEELGGMSSSELLQELKERLDGLKAAESIVGPEAQVLIRFCNKVKSGDIEGLGPEDADFVRLANIALRKLDEYKHLAGEAAGIDDAIRRELARLSGNVDREIANPEGNTPPTDEEIRQQELEDLKDIQGLNVPLNPDELKKMQDLEVSYLGLKEALDLKLRGFELNQDYGNSMNRVMDLYKQLNTSLLTNMTDREKLQFLEGDAISGLEELHRLADIALRDKTVVGENGEQLGDVRLDSAHEVYNTILDNEEIKNALTSSDGNTPKFEDLDMSHINILKEKGVNLSELFLVNTDGTKFTGEITEGKEFLINFSTNENLEGVMDFAFLTSEIQEIKVDNQVLNFDENHFEQDGNMFPMKDGSKIEIIKKFEDDNETVTQERTTEINNYMRQQGVSATQQQTMREALMSSNPSAAFEGETLPGGLKGFFFAMILNLFDGKNFTYNAEKGIWEDGNDELSSGDLIDGSIGNYNDYSGQNIDMSASFEDLPPGVGGLVNIIYQAEANGNPNMIYGGSPIRPPKPITEMTVREVRAFQDRMVASGSASSAVGACQVIRGTMDGAIRSGLLDPNEKFDINAQLKFTLGKMNERGLAAFQAGRMNQATFMENLAKEWASLPKNMSGRSYYAGDGLNHALVSPQVIVRQLQQIRS